MEKVQNYINKVRGRTEEEKRRVAIVWTISITVLIFIIWIIIFSLSVSNDQAREERLFIEAQAKAQALARAKIAASTTQNISSPTEAWWSRVGRFVVEGADSVSTGFWVIGSWLHK